VSNKIPKATGWAVQSLSMVKITPINLSVRLLQIGDLVHIKNKGEELYKIIDVDSHMQDTAYATQLSSVSVPIAEPDWYFIEDLILFTFPTQGDIVKVYNPYMTHDLRDKLWAVTEIQLGDPSHRLELIEDVPTPAREWYNRFWACPEGLRIVTPQGYKVPKTPPEHYPTKAHEIAKLLED